MEAATAQYQEFLPLAADYLEGRGIDLPTAEKYRLGVVGEPFSGSHDIYRGRLSIPYLTRAGVVNVKFRELPPQNSKAKYLCLPSIKTKLYNVNAFFAVRDLLVVTEGELDALVVTEYAGIPAVGVPGASNWNPLWNRLFAGVPRVLVVGDGDDAGKEFARSVAELLDAEPLVLPPGEDCNSIYMNEGPMALMQTLEVF